MKFFLNEEIFENEDGTDNGFEIFARESAAYAAHLEDLRGVLPDRVLQLAEPYGMEDGLVAEVAHDRERQVLTLVLRCGDLNMGYCDLALKYGEATIWPEHDRILASIAQSTESERRHPYDLSNHELDITDDGRIEHRFLFHPGVWFAIQCRSLDWERVPRSSRRLPEHLDRYPGGPT